MRVANRCFGGTLDQGEVVSLEGLPNAEPRRRIDVARRRKRSLRRGSRLVVTGVTRDFGATPTPGVETCHVTEAGRIVPRHSPSPMRRLMSSSTFCAPPLSQRVSWIGNLRRPWARREFVNRPSVVETFVANAVGEVLPSSSNGKTDENSAKESIYNSRWKLARKISDAGTVYNFDTSGVDGKPEV